MEKYCVTLTPEERLTLQQLITTGRTAARRIIHARILLLADTRGDDLNDETLAETVGCSLRTVSRVRHQFVTLGFEAAIARKQQPTRPLHVKIKGDLEQRLVKIACSDPPEGRCHWTLRLLGDELVALGLIESISTETIRQALQKTI